MKELSFFLVAGAVVTALVWRLWWRYRRGLAVPTPFADVPVRQIQLDDWQIRYHMSGQGPCLVLLHGLGANLFCWRDVLPLLNKRYTLVAPDLPGFGQSLNPQATSFGLDDQVERLKRFLTHLGVRPAAIVGNSMGGNIALWYTLNSPDPTLDTILIAPAASPALVPLSFVRWQRFSPLLARLVSRPGMAWLHRRTVSKKHLVDQDRVTETYNTYKGKPDAVRSFLLAMESIRDPRLRERLDDLQGRLLILYGSRDLLVPRSVIDDLKAARPEAEMHIHNGGGHHLQGDEPEWVSEKIDAFMRARLDKQS